MMVLSKVFCKLLCLVLVDSYIIGNNNNNIDRDIKEDYINDDFSKSDLVPAVQTVEENAEEKAINVFNGVYAECFLYLSYSCIQKKTLAYLQQLNNLNEISVLGDYVKFVKANISKDKEESANQISLKNEGADDLTQMIDTSIDKFFDNHVLRFKALGRDVTMPRTVDEFVGRKKRKGGGGGSGGDDGGGGHDKKKMMMMAMMCMKMKLMMMVPAMMGMMGMMSFKGMMFSMMSFMISKMMLLMKILEAKKGGGGGGGGGGDAGWAAGGGGGGAWMPAGGSDYSGGGGGGYDANGQWQTGRALSSDTEKYNRNLPDETGTVEEENHPIITYVTPANHNTEAQEEPFLYSVKKLRHEIIKMNTLDEYGNDEKRLKSQPKSRKKRGIVDMIQSAYLYWLQKLIGPNRLNKYGLNYPKYKIINGVKYVYSPVRNVYKPKAPKAIQPESINSIKPTEGFKPIVMVEDYNKGEIVEVAEEGRKKKNKLQEMKETVDEVVEEDPWQ